MKETTYGVESFRLTMFMASYPGASTIVLNPKYGEPSHRGARTRVFVVLGVSGVVPFTHALLTHGPQNLMREMGFGYLLLSGFFYLTGAII
jgi:adiponectin receptor